ncbi:MAG TPA: type II secretion system protein [Candidatus Aquilonibacter sp.]|nr:type II secretion system protein [Candidatus Aquilonibacter sp.]
MQREHKIRTLGQKHAACARVRTAHGSAGMTLLELMVACSILIILATVAMPMERVTIKRHKEQELRYDLRQMRDAIDRYKDYADKNLFQVQAGTEGYPPDLEALVDGVTLTSSNSLTGTTGNVIGNLVGNAGASSSSAPARKMHFLREIPVDPMTDQTDWVLRSVQDDPDSTSWGGEDVFDVHCPSTDTALDGTKYSDW